MVLLILMWLALYIFWRLGKRKGRPQMEYLHRFMMNILMNNQVFKKGEYSVK
jgi:hypothetical protein